MRTVQRNSRRVLSLDRAPRETPCVIRAISDDRSRTQLIRLGLNEGETVRVIQRMPGGTVVIEKGRREIALGAALAKRILVESIESDHPGFCDA